MHYIKKNKNRQLYACCCGLALCAMPSRPAARRRSTQKPESPRLAARSTGASRPEPVFPPSELSCSSDGWASSGRAVRERCLRACQQTRDPPQDGGLLLLTAHRHTCSQCDTADSYHIVNQAQIQEEMGV